MANVLNNFASMFKFTYVELAYLIIALLFLRLLEHIWSNRDFYIKIMKIPGPPALPLIGCGYIFLRDRREFLAVAETICKKYPKLCRIILGPIVTVIVTDPEYIETAFNHPHAIDKSYPYDIVTEVFGPGILTSSGKTWKVHRKAINPSFSKVIVDSYLGVFNEVGTEFLDRIKKLEGQKNVDWLLLFKRLSLEIGCKTIMGINLDSIPSEKEEDLGYCLDVLSKIGTIRFFRFIYHIPFVYRFSEIRKTYERYRIRFDKIVAKIVRDKIVDFQENKKHLIIDTEVKSKRKNLLDLLLEESTFTEETLKYEVNTFLAAATDTTGISICTILLMLAMHPEEQEKVYKEVIEVIGPNRSVELADLSNLKYTERVIKETLRLFSPAIMIGRKLTGDLQLGKYTIPAGTELGFLPVLTHRNPDYWDDPLKFDPDRFLPENTSKRHMATYYPFAYGARSCIGRYYAYQNLKTLIAIIIRDFRVFSEHKKIEELKHTLGGTLTFTIEPSLWFQPRNVEDNS